MMHGIDSQCGATETERDAQIEKILHVPGQPSIVVLHMETSTLTVVIRTNEALIVVEAQVVIVRKTKSVAGQLGSYPERVKETHDIVLLQTRSRPGLVAGAAMS